MRLHLGHHFYGAGNLGDDFMLGGFLAAMATVAPEATFSLATPFPLDPMRRRFPQIQWLSYTADERAAAIRSCDAWVGLGGSPFQSAQSGWFIDHLTEEAAWCARDRKPMYFLGVGVQEEGELLHPEVRAVCAQAAAIWTRDTASAQRLAALVGADRVRTAADLAHVWFSARTAQLATPAAGTVTLALNFDHRHELNPSAVLVALNDVAATDRVWLAQERRPLPGGEKELLRALPAAEQERWRLVEPDVPGAPLETALERWPAGEWLVTSRFHAAIAGAWLGARVLVLVTNEKLRGVADELEVPAIAADAEAGAILTALRSCRPAARPERLAQLARRSVGEMVAAIRALSIGS